jgi:hypothetical protein
VAVAGPPKVILGDNLPLVSSCRKFLLRDDRAAEKLMVNYHFYTRME